MNCRRQALKFRLYPVVVVVIQIFCQLLLEVIHGLKLLQIQQLAFKQTKEILNYGVIQTVTFSAHTLPDALLPQHLPVQFVLVLPALIGMKDQIRPIWNLCKSLGEHGCHRAQQGTIRNRITDQIAAVQIENRRQIKFLAK